MEHAFEWDEYIAIFSTQKNTLWNEVNKYFFPFCMGNML